MDKKTKSTAPALIIRRTINAKRDRVFAAWTKPEIMAKWFCPGEGTAEVKNDLRIGGSYSNTMTVKTAEGETKSILHTGEYVEISPPERIVFTWNSPFATDSRVTIELRDVGESTELTLTHELLENEDLRQKHNSGWDGCLTNLAKHLETTK